MAVEPATRIRIPISAWEDWLELRRELHLRGLPSRLVSRQGRHEAEIEVDAGDVAEPQDALGDVLSVLERWLGSRGEDSLVAQIGYRVHVLRRPG